MPDTRKPDALAVALYYDGRNAPRITAKGEAALAEEIIAIASAFAVPTFEQTELAQTLYKMELNDEVPEQLYIAVAEIIAFAYLLEDRTPGDPRPVRDPQPPQEKEVGGKHESEPSEYPGGSS